MTRSISDLDRFAAIVCFITPTIQYYCILTLDYTVAEARISVAQLTGCILYGPRKTKFT